MVKKSIKNLERLVVGATLLVSSLLYNPNKVYSDDVKVTQEVSFVKPGIDNDGDGLLNTVETDTGTYISPIDTGTDPNNADTDGDLIPDGIEVYFEGSADPNDPNKPGVAGQSIFYENVSTQDLTKGISSSGSSAWIPTGQIIYSESSGGTNTVYEKDLFDISQPRESLFTGVDDYSSFAIDPLGTFIYFQRTVLGSEKIYKFNRGTKSSPTDAVPGEATNLRRPALSLDLMLDSGRVVYDGNAYLIVESGAILGSKIMGYKLTTNPKSINFGGWDGSQPIEVTNNDSSTVLFPKVSPDGNDLMFTELQAGGKNRLYVYRGLRDVLSGATTSFSVPTTGIDLRGSIIRTEFDGVTLPGGFAKDFAYWVRDINNNFVLDDPSNFSTSDFDIEMVNLGINGIRFGPVGNFHKNHIIDNQINVAPSFEGGRVMVSDDYLSGNGTFDLYASSVAPSERMEDLMDVANLNTFVHQSGLSIEGNSGDDKLDINQPYDLFRIFTPKKPVSDAGSFGSFVTNIKSFAPNNLTVTSDINTSPSLKMMEPWSVYDLITRDGIFDPSTFTKGVEIDGEYVDLDSKMFDKTINVKGDGYFMVSLEGLMTTSLKSLATTYGLSGASIENEVQNYGIQGEMFPIMSSARHWQLYDTSTREERRHDSRVDYDKPVGKLED